jgi:Gram-negative bacterial TonB protein C-terminal
MRSFVCALRFSSAFLFVATIHLRAQDMPLRVEAVRLLEHANAVSRSTHILPNRKLDVTFRAFGLDGTHKDGIYSIIYAVDSERYETHFGDYHAISIHLPDKIVQNGYTPPPMETLEVSSLAPIDVGRFDLSDTINSITPATLFGRRAKCIQFETVTGRSHQSNEVCVDEDLGTIIRKQVGDELVEFTDYFSFEGVLFPAHMRHYINGKLRMELEQKFTLIDGPIDWDALTPPNATTLLACTQYRRPILQSAPQPPSAGPGPWYDVDVHVTIGSDGHIHNPAVLPAGRPDLGQEAIQIVSGWFYSPPTCDGKPIPVHATLKVHFPLQ